MFLVVCVTCRDELGICEDWKMFGACNVLTSKTYRSHIDQEGRFRVDVAAVRGGGEVVVVTFWKELPNVGPSLAACLHDPDCLLIPSYTVAIGRVIMLP
jgi:hypothetical protein